MQWQKKLYQHEEIPPVEVWQKLQQEIADDPAQLRTVLSEFESDPPADAWQQIAVSISDVELTPVIDLRARNYNRLYSYAAIIVGAMLIISALLYVYINNKQGLDATEFSTSIIRTDSPDKAKPGLASSGITSSLNKPSVSFDDGNYIQVLSSEGGYNRISYKFYEMVQAMYSDSLKYTSGAQGKKYWQHTITSWKEKIGQSSYVPAGSNFFDLAEMISMLEENK